MLVPATSNPAATSGEPRPTPSNAAANAGALAWWLWGAVHILFLARRRNQFSVILGWVWSYFTFDVGVRLITGDGPSRAGAALAGEQPE